MIFKLYLNTINYSWLSGHDLNLKIGVPIILLRNVDQPSGVCNGKHLINTQIENYVFGENLISQSSTSSDPKNFFHIST